MYECRICLGRVAHLEEHHIIPREYGGENLDTVNICSTCHHGLHHQANVIWTARHQNKTADRSYFAAQDWERASPYVAAILEARKDFEELGSPEVRPRRLMFSVSNSLLQKLHKLKKYHGYRSLDRFIVSRLEQLVDKEL